MGVYINMEMPKSCAVCPFENYGDCYGGKVKAIMDIDDYVSSGKRHPRCPLVHVPEHGDFIDRDALKEAFCGNCFADEKPMECSEPCIDMRIILEAPTIIEAEPPKEEA